MPKIEFIDPNGIKSDFALLDGYIIRECLLEGVMFRVSVVERPSGRFKLEASLDDPKDIAYLEHNYMSLDKILEDVIEVAKERDEFEDGKIFYCEGITTDPEYAYSFNEICYSLAVR